MSKLLIGIDVAKDISTAQGIDQEGQKQFYIEFSMDAKGFSLVLKKIRGHSRNMS